MASRRPWTGALLNAPGTMAVNFPVADGEASCCSPPTIWRVSSWRAIRSRSRRPSRTVPLPSASTTVPAAPATLTLAYNGKLRDRVGQGETALGPDGALDGTLTATLSGSGGGR